MEKAAKYSGINGKSQNKYEVFQSSPFLRYNCKLLVLFLSSSFIFFWPSVLREQYYMVQKLGGGGFGTVYMVQVTLTYLVHI